MTQVASGYKRRPQDLYETPAWVTDGIMTALADRLPKGAPIWEPCAGNGKMVEAIEATGRTVFASDFVGRPSLNLVGDVRHLSAPIGAAAIITNPPYQRKLTEEIIEHCLLQMKPRDGLVAMLLKVDFDSGKSRSHLFGDCEAFAQKLVIKGRINWFPLKRLACGKVRPGSTDNHAIFVWDWRTVGRSPTIGYIDKPAGVDEVEPLEKAA